MNRRHRTKAISALFCLLILAGMVGADIDMAHGQSAGTLYKQGETAESRDDIDTAYDRFYRAFQKNPQDLRYRTAYFRLRFSCAALHTKRGVTLREKGDYSAALTEFLHALEVDPSNELAKQEIEATREKMKTPGGESSIPKTAASELSEVASPIELKPISNEPITLHMSEDTKVVYQTIGKAAGINVLFDPEYTSKRIQIDLSNVSLYDGLRIMGAVSGTFWRAVTSNTIFVAANTRAKRTELDEQAVQTFYLTNASQANDLNDIQTALRNVLANAKLYGVPSQNAIVMRGTPDELLLASKLIDDLDKARPEVVVDIAVLEVSRDKMRNIGISLPGTASVSLQSATASTTSTTTGTGTGTTSTPTTSTGNLTLNTLSQLNANNFAVTIGQATANLLLSDTNTRILQNPRIRASDNQKATMKIGSRIPIATGSFSSGTSSALASSLVNTQFQYLDIGVNIDMTPVVHYDRDVTLKLKIEVSSHNGDVTISGVTEPIISQRTIEQVIRLREGEANILGGILSKQDSRVINGTPGLGELPFLKYLFSTNSHDVQQDEIVFLMIPHVVRATQLSLLNTRQIDTGTGNTVEIRHLAAVAPPPAPVGQAASESSVAQSPAPPQLQQGQAVPGQSAAGAAANALAVAPRAGSAQAGQPPMPMALQLVPANGTQKIGSTFQIAVNLSGGKDVFSVPLQVWFDSTKLTLINVDSGSFLGRDGQAVALVHRDDGSGNVTVSASRPPGVAGVEGAGTVCIFTFQAKTAGDAIINITKPGARNSAQQAIETTGSQAMVHVQ